MTRLVCALVVVVVTSLSPAEPPLDDAWMFVNSDPLVAINSLAFSIQRRFFCPLIDFFWSVRRVPVDVQFIHELVPPVLYIIRPLGEPFSIPIRSRELMREARCGDVANSLVNLMSIGDFGNALDDAIRLRSINYDFWMMNLVTRSEIGVANFVRAFSEITPPIHVPRVSMDRMVMMLERSILGSFACQQLITSDAKYHLSTRMIVNKFLAIDVFLASSIASSVSMYLHVDSIKTANLVCGDIFYALNRVSNILESYQLVVQSGAEAFRSSLATTKTLFYRRLGCPDLGVSQGRVVFTREYISLVCGPDVQGLGGYHVRFNVHPECITELDAHGVDLRCDSLALYRGELLNQMFESRSVRVTNRDTWPASILNL